MSVIGGYMTNTELKEELIVEKIGIIPYLV